MHDLMVEMLKSEHLLLYFFAYGLGAIPSSYLVARFGHKINLRKAASPRHTASHIFTTMSKWSGMLVFSCDLAKGLLPAAIASSLNAPVEVIALIGFFAVLGHCFSLWLWFLGGHGGTTAAGALLVVYWPASLAILVANLLLILLGLSAGLASIMAIFVGIIVLFLALANKVVLLIVLAMAAVILARHWSSFS